MNTARRPSFTLNSFFSTLDHNLEPYVRSHLKSVYSCLALSTFAAAFGSYMHLAGIITSGLLTLGLCLGTLTALFVTADDGKNQNMRMGLLVSFALCTGINLGPLLDMAITINPALISKAFLASSLIFGCFTLSALLAPSRKFLYLGGFLLTGLTTLLTLSLANLFFGSVIVFRAGLYLALAVFCGFVLYDTHLIIEKRRAGDKDFVTHSVYLFTDLVDIFRYLLIILMDKEANKSKRRD